MIDTTLGSVITSAPNERLPPDKYRKYVANLTTDTLFNGELSVSSTPIVYSIGRRYNYERVVNDEYVYKKTGLEEHHAKTPAFVCETEANPTLVEEVARSIGVRLVRLSLRGLVERLAAGLAFYSIGSDLSYEILSGGSDVRLVAVDTTARPGTVMGRDIFVSVEVVDDMHIFAALLAAANGEDATVYSDRALVDPSTNVVQDPTKLAMGCWKTLNYIAQMYEASNAGAQFAYAFVRGLHKILTVIAHTEEGGITRDILRSGRFDVPHGMVVALRQGKYNGMPEPFGNRVSITRFVDSILLSSAGLVSCCDPLIEYNGRMFPTIYTTSIGDDHLEQDAGLGFDGTPEDGIELGTQLSGSCHCFASIYINAIRKMFKFSEGSEKLATLHFVACATSIKFENRRSFHFKIIAPWYWIEPTGTVYADTTETAACEEGYGPLCSPGQPGVLNMFSSCAIRNSSCFGTDVYVDWRSARKHGMIIHCLMRKKDGLANVKVCQAAHDQWALVGGEDKTMRECLINADSLDMYMSGHRHCTIPPPAELMYTGNSVGLLVTHMTGDTTNYYGATAQHSPNANEITHGVVNISVTSVTFSCIGKFDDITAKVKRAQSFAIGILERYRTKAPGARYLPEPMRVRDADGPAFYRPIKPQIALANGVETFDGGLGKLEKLIDHLHV